MNSAASLVPLSWLPQAAEEPPEEASGPLACGAEHFIPALCPGVAGEQGWCSLQRSGFGCSAINSKVLKDSVIASGVTWGA